MLVDRHCGFRSQCKFAGTLAGCGPNQWTAQEPAGSSLEVTAKLVTLQQKSVLATRGQF